MALASFEARFDAKYPGDQEIIANTQSKFPYLFNPTNLLWSF
jgi:hypothetical protein